MTIAKRYIPICLILLIILILYFTGMMDYLSFEAIKQHHHYLTDAVDRYPMLSPVIYVIFYIIITSLSLPIDVLLAMLGGLLFPQPYSTIYATIGATIGAIILYLVAKTTFGDYFTRSVGGKIKAMEDGFRKNAAFYMLFLRLVPIFPFWMVNIAPALIGVPLFTFAWTSFFGIIPPAFAFTQAGAALVDIFEKNQEVTLGNVLNADMKIALAVLGIFALIPILIKNYCMRDKKAS